MNGSVSNETAWKHRELNLARNFELPLERQPVGDLQQHQQIDEDETDDERERAVSPDRRQDRDWNERQAQGNVDEPEASEQPDDARERDDERADVKRAACR